eukprot:CAMPEP_0185847064 /NCGR_PEP_ID=MMETSP1354-20130828/2476_1 /TAXON_ID=708628 /ORGANISM="Erythrolobus madagascarensis, Strain CCMP3276" /LENGTH=124 /DNA_ID=CAMNT_0028547313 /DNA_START=1177 /DNA_END=1547 /DNA_ORIENTATION=+
MSAPHPAHPVQRVTLNGDEKPQQNQADGKPSPSHCGKAIKSDRKRGYHISIPSSARLARFSRQARGLANLERLKFLTQPRVDSLRIGGSAAEQTAPYRVTTHAGTPQISTAFAPTHSQPELNPT